jgi:hypothetical protein
MGDCPCCALTFLRDKNAQGGGQARKKERPKALFVANDDR